MSKITDIFTGIASIETLAAISLERMYAIGWPIRHRALNVRVYMFAITIPWILGAIFTSIAILGDFSIITSENYVYTRTLFLGTPLLLMCIAYYVVWKKKKKTMMGNRNHVVSEKRLAKTLFIITAASLLTWVPFQILLLLIGNLDYVNPPVLMIIKFLQFSNSLVNVTIYPFTISEFKNTLLQMLRCCAGVCPRDGRIEVGPMQQGGETGSFSSCSRITHSNS